ncbi:hypothetical protein [Endothiovibrio diazotrophicus]
MKAEYDLSDAKRADQVEHLNRLRQQNREAADRLDDGAHDTEQQEAKPAGAPDSSPAVVSRKADEIRRNLKEAGVAEEDVTDAVAWARE